jgi:hypothetical protein
LDVNGSAVFWTPDKLQLPKLTLSLCDTGNTNEQTAECQGFIVEIILKYHTQKKYK